MRLILLGVLALLVATALGQTPGPAQDSDGGHVLRWKFKPKDRFQTESVMQMMQLRRVGGQLQARDGVQVTTLATFTVKEVGSDGSAVLTQKIDSVRCRIDGQLPASATATAEILTRLQGATFTLTLDPDGKVQQFDGYADFIKQLDKRRPGEGDAFKRQIPEDDMKKASEEGFALFPDKSIQVGSTWERSATVNLVPLGALEVKLEYTLESVQKGKAKIVFSAKSSELRPMGGGNKPDFNLEDRSGTIVFDLQQGRLDSYDSKLRFNGAVTLPSADTGLRAMLEFFQQQQVRIKVRAAR
ncbi:MAG TPA: DUF6263 family protein [Gemmatales bacterium]|nr:DUF6263 family protein [Gemmatales bacterium]HMP59625.1 DUF6263 family protein [Gemmatales bacterium]